MAQTCPTGNTALDTVKGFFDFLGDPIGTILSMLANAILKGAIMLFGIFTSEINTMPGAQPTQNISDQLRWLVVLVAVGSLLFAAVRMALERRGEAGGAAAKGIVRLIVVGGGMTTIATAASGLADRFAAHLFAQSADTIDALETIGCSERGDGIPSFLLLILALLLLVSALINMIVMLVRLGVVTMLLGTLPLAAAASMTDWGVGWWRKHIGWLIAWVLYKPAAALIIYSGSTLLDSDGSGKDADAVQDRLAGIAIILLSSIALPALLKLVVPATAALGTGNAGGQAATAVAGSMASGARSVAGSSGGSGPSGAMGKPGSAGSAGASGGAGASGAAGASGGSGAGAAAAGGMPGTSGAGGASGGAGAAGASGAGAAAGPVGVAIAAGKIAAGAATSAIEGADGDRGHNR